jgi:uncharacterized protein (DUF433 family)
MNWQDYIEEKPGVMLGKPVFKGTRITVEHVLQELGGGMTENELLEGHPRLTAEHIQAAIQYRIEHPPQREIGFLKGKIIMSDDFDDPLEDFEPYM